MPPTIFLISFSSKIISIFVYGAVLNSSCTHLDLILSTVHMLIKSKRRTCKSREDAVKKMGRTDSKQEGPNKKINEKDRVKTLKD